MKPLKLLFFCGGTYVAGGELHMLRVMKALASRGHDVRCVASGWNDGHWIDLLRESRIPHHVSKLGFLYFKRPWWTLGSIANYPKAFHQNARLLNAFRPNFTFHMSYRTIIMLRPLLRRESTIFFHLEVPDANYKTKAIYGYIRSRVGHHIANSMFTKCRLVDVFRLPKEQISVSYPIIYETDASIEATRNPPSQSDTIRIGMVGQIIPMKGHRELIAALSRLPDIRKNLSLEIFGNGDNVFIQELMALAKQCGLESKVRFHGFVREQGEIYGNLDFVVVPTIGEEAFGMVAAEPAIWGIPTVATRSGGISEIVIDGVTGRLVERDNIESLAGAITEFITSPTLRYRLGKAAQSHVAEKFSSEKSVCVIETALMAMLGRHPHES